MYNVSAAVSALAMSLAAPPALAQGSLEGNWKLALGKKAPCEISMTADGTATPGAECPSDIARWKGTSTGVQLQTAGGATYAVLKSKGGAYEGTTIGDMRTVTLTR